jgi:hypothetical protein
MVREITTTPKSQNPTPKPQLPKRPTPKSQQSQLPSSKSRLHEPDAQETFLGVGLLGVGLLGVGFIGSWELGVGSWELGVIFDKLVKKDK